MLPSDFSSGGFTRGTPAYDVPSDAPAALVYPAAYDGFDINAGAVYLGLLNLLNEIKAAGVAAIIELEGQ